MRIIKSLAAGPHPRRELTLIPRRGVAWPRLVMAAGAGHSHWQGGLVILLGVALATSVAAAQESPAERGPQAYDKWCTPCHGAGEGKPGTIAAAAIYKSSKPSVLAERTDLTPAGIRTAVRSGMFVMPRFRKTEVTDAELDAIIAFLTRRAEPKR